MTIDESRSSYAHAVLKTIIGEYFLQDNAVLADPIAKSFSDIAVALRDGMDPNDVAVACDAAANALCSPADIDELEQAARDTLKELESKRRPSSLGLSSYHPVRMALRRLRKHFDDGIPGQIADSDFADFDLIDNFLSGVDCSRVPRKRRS